MKLNDTDIDKIIKDSIKNTTVPKEIFEEAYKALDNKKTDSMLFRYLVGIAAIIIVVFLVITNIHTDTTDNTLSTPELSGETEAELPVASDIINTLGESYQPTLGHIASPSGLTLVEEEAQFVGVVKVEKILGYTNYIKGQNLYSRTPFIISKVSVEKVYKGTLNGEIEIISYGGVISISDYEKALQKEQSLDSKYKNLSPEEKENTYIRIINSTTMKTIEPEVGKYYLVFMNYSKNLESYQVLDDLIYEYDINKDKTKNTNTNEWETYEFGRK